MSNKRIEVVNDQGVTKSPRAEKGNLTVIRTGFKCKFYGHHKGLNTMMSGTKCSKCKRKQK